MLETYSKTFGPIDVNSKEELVDVLTKCWNNEEKEGIKIYDGHYDTYYSSLYCSIDEVVDRYFPTQKKEEELCFKHLSLGEVFIYNDDDVRCIKVGSDQFISLSEQLDKTGGKYYFYNISPNRVIKRSKIGV